MRESNIMRRLIRIIRNILLLAIAVIVILAGVLAFNTFTHGSRQLQVAAVPRAEVDAQARPSAWPKRSASGPFRATKSPTSTPKRCAACARISKRAFRHFMPRRSAKSSVATACSTHGQAPTRGRSRSHCSRIRTSCRWRRAPRRTGNSRPLTASLRTASSGAAAPGTTRATSIPCWRPPRRWPRPASAPSERSILRSAMTRRPRAPPAPNRSRRCSPRAASASTS